MQTAQTPTTDAGLSAINSTPDRSAAELKFISDLGRSLLLTVHPKKVASRVAEISACGSRRRSAAFAVELENIGAHQLLPLMRSGEIEGTAFNKSRFEKWLAFMPPQIGYLETTEAKFLIAGKSHHYVNTFRRSTSTARSAEP